MSQNLSKAYRMTQLVIAWHGTQHMAGKDRVSQNTTWHNVNETPVDKRHSRHSACKAHHSDRGDHTNMIFHRARHRKPLAATNAHTSGEAQHCTALSQLGQQRDTRVCHMHWPPPCGKSCKSRSLRWCRLCSSFSTHTSAPTVMHQIIVHTRWYCCGRQV